MYASFSIKNSGFVMRTTLFAILLLTFSISSVAETLTFPDIVGKWKLYKPDYGIQYKIARWLTGNYRIDNMLLTITDKENIQFVREFKNSEDQTMQASHVQIVDDLYIISFPLKTGGMYKLTLSGWSSDHMQLLFGYFYLYNEEGLFNGWSVTFELDESEDKANELSK